MRAYKIRSGLEFFNDSINHLNQTGKWAKFLAILGLGSINLLSNLNIEPLFIFYADIKMIINKICYNRIYNISILTSGKINEIIIK